MTPDLKNILLGAVGSLLAVFILWLCTRGRNFLSLFGASHGLAIRLKRNGVRRLALSRDDYHERPGGTSLRAYLATAAHSIEMVSLSLKLTQDEGDLISLFRSRLFEKSDFRVSISLLDPLSPAVKYAATSLDVVTERMQREIKEMLEQLLEVRESLPEAQKTRLKVLIHDSFPMGSAILLDATPSTGTIQVETKLYRAPRTESFGYEVVGPSPFFSRNYLAWKRVLDDSKEISNTEIQSIQTQIAKTSL